MSWPFSKKETSTVVVIDIRTSSISAGYVYLKKGALPYLLHSVQFPVDPHATEPLSDAMPRTLELVLTSLISSGTEVLSKKGLSTSTDRILISISSPWQASHIASVKSEQEKTFAFTESVLEHMTSEVIQAKEGRKVVSQLVLSTFLNGYETQNAFGKEAKTVEIITLSTDMDEKVHDLIRTIVKKAFHQSHIDTYAFLPELYAVLKEVLPSQREYLVCDVGSDATDLILIKHGLLLSSAVQKSGIRNILDAVHKSGLSTHTIPTTEGTPADATGATFQHATETAKNAWVAELKDTLSSIAKEEPLPRMMCIVTEPAVSEFVKRLLDAPELRSLWLSDEPLTLVPLTANALLERVASGDQTRHPFPLYVLAVSSQKRYGV